jgi:uncharacterized membrane protein YccC
MNYYYPYSTTFLRQRMKDVSRGAVVGLIILAAATIFIISTLH